MALTAAMQSAGLDVDPGGEVSCDLTVQNTGSVVDRVVLDVLGDTTTWAKVEPDSLNLLPGTSETVRLTFHPPRTAAVPAGDFAFAVRAMSSEDPAGSVIEEGVVHVGAYTHITANLVPRTATGRRAGRYKFTVENRGNTVSHVQLLASDPDDSMEFRFYPPEVLAAPGTATFVRLRVAPYQRFLKGPNKSLPFQAFALPDSGDPVSADGVLLQQQTLPRWLIPVVALLAAGVVILIALWYLLFKPSVDSAATDAVQEQTKDLKSNAAEASKAADRANEAADKADGGPTGDGSKSDGSKSDGSKSTAPNGSTKSSASKSASPGGRSDSPADNAAQTTTPNGTGGGAGGNAESDLLRSDVEPGKSGTYSYTLPNGYTRLSVFDIVMQNPNADTGTLLVQAGDKPLLEFSLADFRTLDYHFVQPLVFTKDRPLTLRVECRNVGGTSCQDGLSFSGQLGK